VSDNDCRTCGACCSFSETWPELGVDPDGENIPLEMIDCEIGRMRCVGDRCCALEGTIGVAVRCRIYENRPAVCREFGPADRRRDCNTARAWHGLPPLLPMTTPATQIGAGSPSRPALGSARWTARVSCVNTGCPYVFSPFIILYKTKVFSKCPECGAWQDIPLAAPNNSITGG
jgi:Fe-S-cluster containining protein